jgi:hypothetical protein
MDKLYIFAIAIGILILVSYFYSRMTPKTTTTKKVVVTKPVVYIAPKYGYKPPPPHYNPYKAQYY